ncbi:MAG: chemotaxis protein CheW [Coriobacteriia bacterium]|nr:chemotaxis protein CheW [Coriobacteriia bacterium]
MSALVEQGSRPYVIFRLGAEEYGIGISRVSGIIRYEASTPVPKAPESVLGVINLRGRVIPIVDLCQRLGRGKLTHSAHSRIIVVDCDSGSVGLAVDEANEVVAIPIDSIGLTPDAAVSAHSAEMIEGVADRGGRLVILLDLDKTVPRGSYARPAKDADLEVDEDV